MYSGTYSSLGSSPTTEGFWVLTMFSISLSNDILFLLSAVKNHLTAANGVANPAFKAFALEHRIL